MFKKKDVPKIRKQIVIQFHVNNAIREHIVTIFILIIY